MWGTVLVLALVAATDPVRLGTAVLLISRPRPMLNLLAFWLGGMTTGIAAALGVLILLRDFTPIFMQNVASTAAGSTARHIQIAIGVLALLIAALIAVGFSARERVPMPGGDPSALVLRPSNPTAFSRLSARAQDALDGGSLWVAFLAGLGMATPPVPYLAALVAILASGAAIGTQVSAAVIFTVVAFAVVEIPLVSYLATPAKTHAVMLQLHDWVRARRRRILAVVVAVVGVMLVATGMSSV
jgi:Sap-like sulfolipid-1-addressing protein